MFHVSYIRHYVFYVNHTATIKDSDACDCSLAEDVCTPSVSRHPDVFVSAPESLNWLWVQNSFWFHLHIPVSLLLTDDQANSFVLMCVSMCTTLSLYLVSQAFSSMLRRCIYICMCPTTHPFIPSVCHSPTCLHRIKVQTRSSSFFSYHSFALLLQCMHAEIQSGEKCKMKTTKIHKHTWP